MSFNTSGKNYDDRNRLVEEIDAKGKSTKYTLDDASQLKEIINTLGKVTKYEYDDLGRLITVTKPLDLSTNAVTKTEYDKNGNVTATIDAENRRTEYVYNSVNRRTQMTDALGQVTQMGYDAIGNLTSVKNAKNQETQSVYDELNRQVKTIDALSRETVTTYDLAGNVKSIKDVSNYTVSYDYDKNNRRTEVKDERGVIQTTKYNGVGKVDFAIDANGFKTQYNYNDRNWLIEVVDQFGATTKTEYDKVGNIAYTLDANNGRIDYNYDENNRRTEVIKTVNGSQFKELTSYDDLGRVKSTTDGEGRVTQYEYDDLNRLTKTIKPLNRVNSYVYDKVGNTLSVSDALGRVTKSEYDKLNRKKSITAVFGTVDATTISYDYDEIGNVRFETNGRGFITEYDYDDLNRQTKTVEPGNYTSRVEYYDTPGLIASLNLSLDSSQIGKVVKNIDALNNSTLTIYDKFGRLVETIDESGHSSSKKTYYNDDRVKSSTDTFGQTTNYTYLDVLRKTEITNPLGLVVTKTYDKVGNLKEVTDSQQRTTSYDYDELNRQTSVTDAEGGITSYTYYNDGQTKSVKDAANNITSYTYDGAGRLATETSPLGTRTYGYNAADNRTSVVDRNGRETRYDYDNLNRVKSELWVGNGKTFTYTYDKNSNRLTGSDGNVGYSYSYDERDLLTSVNRTDSNVSFNYSYDAVGNLTKSEESIGNIVTATTTYKYDDPRSLNTEIIQSGTNLENKRVKFSYDQFGLNTGIERYVNELLTPNSQLSTLNSYDNYGRLKGISHSNSAGVIGESSYEKDLLNRLTSETKDGANRQFNYDKTDQVKGVSGSNNEAYSYDKNGNRVNTGYVTGTGNRLISDGVYSYDYDAEGNRTKRTKIGSGEVEEYTWDYRDRLTSVVKKDASGVVVQTASYEYDIDDQRVSKSVNGVRENYYLDGNQIAFVTDAQGNRTEHYLYGVNVDQVLAQDSPTGMVWSLADRLGSIDTLTDKNGNVVDKRTFDSFGNLLTQTNPNIDFRYGYTGRELDQETGLHYYRARYYDAGVGRFISVDPIGFDAGDSNLYRYVGNSPTMYTDPTGEVAQVLAGAGFGAVFGGLYSLAKNWETGNFNSGSFGRALLGAGSGAVIGAVASSGVGLLAAAATNYFGTAVAGAVVNTAVTAGSTAYGAYSAGGNFGQGRYLTGTLDLIGTGIGAAKVFSGITKGIPGVYQAESDARFNNARQVYQVGDPQLNSTGAIVKSQPSSLATTTSAWGQSNSTSAIVPAATSATAAVQSSYFSHKDVPTGWNQLPDGSIVASPVRMLPGSQNYYLTQGNPLSNNLARQAGIPDYIDLSKPNNVVGLSYENLMQHYQLRGIATGYV